MFISVVKGNYQRKENSIVKKDTPAYFQLYLPQQADGKTQEMLTIGRLYPNQLNIKPVIDSNGQQGSGYFAKVTSRFNFHLIDSAKLKEEAELFGNLDKFADDKVKWSVVDNQLLWLTPMKDKDKAIIKDCNHHYLIDMPDLGKAIAELQNFVEYNDLATFIDKRVDKVDRSNSRKVAQTRLIG